MSKGRHRSLERRKHIITLTPIPSSFRSTDRIIPASLLIIVIHYVTAWLKQGRNYFVNVVL